MELRPPPTTTQPRGGARVVVGLQVVTLIAVLAGVGVLVARSGATGDSARASRAREVAAKLKAAGAMDEAAALYDTYLAEAQGDAEKRASVAYSLGQLHLERGQYERALRWFYEAESLGAGPLAEQVNQKIVHCLERLGRVHAAQAALSARVGLPAEGEAGTQRPDSDPVVAKLGKEEIRRSDVERSLDDLPPELKRMFAGEQQRAQYLRKYVADELLWRKAETLEYSKDPAVRRHLESLLKQLVVAKFVEREILGKITVDESDLRTYHQANRFQYDLRESAKVRVIKVADLATAERLAKELEGGASFAKLAQANTLHGPSKAAGGAVKDWVFRGDDFLGLRDPPAAILISDAVFATAKGAVSEPVIAGGSAYLFAVEDRREGKQRPFEQVRADVERDYRQMKTQSTYAEVIEQQLATEGVELFPEAMGEP